MRRGFIKLWRASIDNPLYFSEPFTKFQAWVDILLLANFKPRSFSVRGIMVEIGAGQVLAAEEFLANRWQWSRGKVRRFLRYLASESVQQIELQKNNVCTTITVLNWQVYQHNGTADETTNGRQTDTPKKDKNENNERNIPCMLGSLDGSKNSSILHRPEKSATVKLESYKDFCNADITSIFCTICGEKTGPGVGFLSKCLKILAKTRDAEFACEAFRELIFRFWSEIQTGEVPRSITAALITRVKKLPGLEEVCP